MISSEQRWMTFFVAEITMRLNLLHYGMSMNADRSPEHGSPSSMQLKQ